MLSPTVQEALNEQVNAELYSAYLYLAMSADCETRNLRGFAHWLRVQYEEETAHALKIFDFIMERGGKVTLKAIQAPPAVWDSPRTMFEVVLEHEQQVTASVNKLVDLAIAESDHATNNFLQWFVAEQVEEEASADNILQQLKLVAGAPGGLFMLDQQLARRSAGSAGSGEGG
ncbi:MAG TPA: ferritin [Planctomycetaceae bacterium]|nr:ferritin [Planctomycetaceae bacterium]HIQ20633.1 ferritin [Planctomycetota bacterium]